MNWGQLKAQGAKYVHRKDIDWDAAQNLLAGDLDSRLDTVINEGVGQLTPATAAGIPGAWSAPVPANFARVKSVMVGTDEVLPSSETVFFTRPDRARYFAQVGLEMFFGRSNPAIMLYAKRVQLMTSDSDENVEAKYYPHMYLYGLVTHANKLIQDFEAVGLHEQTFEAALGAANAAKDDMRFSSGLGPVLVGVNAR